MSPDEIAATYEVLAPMAGDYANANIERAGQAQASYGPLAQAAMGGSQTAGIGNYTYNRLARPAVDTMRDELVVQGYSDALNRQLSETLRQAQDNYSRAARRHSLNGSSGGTTTTTGGTKWNGEIETEDTPDRTFIGDSYTIVDGDGNSTTYRRPNIFTDNQWYQWGENARKKAESEGKQFKWNK